MEPQAESRTPNRLANETSPYLQQHALNPVDWYPWGEEAFRVARDQDKPIFLSVGYSACHWCHVMEHESFENDAIAALLNEHFVSIKVDREERPDVDQIYMSAVQLITRRGGWPMSVFMTPDGKPFYGGTYWPPTSRMGMPGFRDIILKLADYWNNKRDEVNTSADQLVAAIQDMAAPVFEHAELSEDVLRKGMNQLLSSADRQHGGFGGAPKFPHPMDIRVLLRCWKRFGNQDALDVAALTLDKMARGGIYDHLGGGFHRYSTDAYWLAPHFEKMLYDNALLVPAYLEAFQATGNESFKVVVTETLSYVLREMTAPDGAFYSTQDADSEGEEGKFFVWSEAEIDTTLDDDEAALFKRAYDVSTGGNWEGHTILNRSRDLEQPVTASEWETLAKCREKLFAIREQRIHPGRDEKILVSWNGMMIAAFALAGRVLGGERYVDAAKAAADFLLNTIRDNQGRLLHSYKDGQPRFTAYLDDYACLIDGLVELFQATSHVPYLNEAQRLADEMITHFADQEVGGFFYTANDHEQLIARTKDSQDNAVPSGNAMAATALLKLGRLLGDEQYEQHGISTLESLAGLLVEHPRAAGQALIALDFVLGPTRELVIVPGSDSAQHAEALEVLRTNFAPNVVTIAVTSQDVRNLLACQGKDAIDGKTTFYLCERGTCQQPINDADALRALLNPDAI